MARIHTVVVTPPTMTLIVMATLILTVQIASSQTSTTAAASSPQTQTTATTPTTTQTTLTTTVIPFGQNCSGGGKCASNFICISPPNTCGCSSDQYLSTAPDTCLPKKSKGEVCNADSECRYNLTCVSRQCDCSDGFYYDTSSSLCQLKKSKGEVCNADSECRYNLTCVSRQCDCSDGFYYDISSSLCQLKKSKGEVCNADSECRYNLTCVSRQCDCSDGFYYDTSSSLCKLKLDHGVVCQSPDQCKIPNTNCISYTSTPNKCLCGTGFYWTDNSCLSRNNLKINATVNSRGTRNITFVWNDMSQRSDVSYTIKWGTSDITNANKTGVTVIGLKPGTSYSFTIVSSLLADANYPAIEDLQTQDTVWTYPDTPGLVTGSQRVGNAYEVTFGPSDGSKSRYTMTVTNGTFQETQSNTSTLMRFTNLKPAATYSYSLWSFNGNSERSDPATGQFTTGPEAPGPVSALSLAGVQSHAANVTWQTPSEPRGTITGYLVEVALQDSTECLYYFKIPCHGCAQAPTNISVPTCTLMDGKITGSNSSYYLELPNLKPYHIYKVEVQAVNERGLGESTTVKFQTNISAPNDILNLTVNSVRNATTQKVDLHITWTPGEQTGPTVYYILVQEALGLDTEAYNQSVSPLTVTGYSNTDYVIDDVLAYWNYLVTIWAQTREGNSSQKFEPHKTVENDPGPVENLTVTQNATIANLVTLTFECPELKSRNGRIEKFAINQTLLNPQAQEDKEKLYNHSATDGQLQPCSGVYTVTARNIIVERNYLFTVMTVNNKYEGGLRTVPNFEVPPQVPRPEMLKQLLQVDSLVKAPDTSTEQTKITTVVCSSCLTDDRWGSVRNVGLLLCVKGSQNCTQPGRKKRSTALQFAQFPSWATAKQQGFKTAYRTTPDKWMPLVSGNEQFKKFIVGENTSCNAADLTNYCNGPLPAGQEFYISVIMCTTAGCTVYRETSIFKTAPDDEPSAVGAIVGGVLGGLALVAVIGVIIFLARKSDRCTSPKQQRPPVEHKPEIKEIVKKRPVRMRDFSDHVTKFHKDSNLLFQDEFENIRNVSDTFNNTSDEAKREQNRVKNRWADILPYDHSRVKLNILSDDDETNDFINANYIPGYSSVREYIATQGPLYSTIPDFWKMIWEQKCKVIVMLSDLTEAGKRKVDLYWPENLNEPINYGTVVVEMTNFSQLNHYIIRNFRLIKGEETRKVTHFFLPGWPDYSADIRFDDVLGFVKAVRQEITPDTQGPIVVHCSAGVGRSGTFIALDYFAQFVEKHSLDDSIDVFDFVLQMRKNRTRMVQVETQYIFIYDGINKLIQSKIKSEEERLYENVSPGNGVYENFKQQEENIYANTAVKDDDKYVYNNEAFEPDFSHSQKSDKPTTEL